MEACVTGGRWMLLESADKQHVFVSLTISIVYLCTIDIKWDPRRRLLKLESQTALANGLSFRGTSNKALEDCECRPSVPHTRHRHPLALASGPLH